MNNHKIVLIGFMGSGKSTIASHLATLYNTDVYEMDAEILRRTQYSHMGDLFAAKGEVYFREQEIALAKEWGELSKGIFSTGGGVVQNKIILDYFRSTRANVVYLHLDFEMLALRVENDTSSVRPLFQNRLHAEQLYTLRLPLYHAYADFVIENNMQNPEEIAEKIYHYSLQQLY